MINATREHAHQLARILCGDADQGYICLEPLVGRKFANSLYLPITSLHELRADEHLREHEQHASELREAIRTLTHVLQMKLASANMVEVMDELAKQDESEQRHELTAELQTAQRQLASRLKERHELLRAQVSQLNTAAQRLRHQRERDLMPAQLPVPSYAITMPATHVAGHVVSKVRSSLRDGQAALHEL